MPQAMTRLLVTGFKSAYDTRMLEKCQNTVKMAIHLAMDIKKHGSAF
jgi:hypothetical protein